MTEESAVDVSPLTDPEPFESGTTASTATPTAPAGNVASRERGTVDSFQVTLHKAKETKNTVRYEEPESGDPPVIGTLYLQKWATHRLGDPESIVVTIEPLAGVTTSA